MQEGDKLLDLAAIRLQETVDSEAVGEQKMAVILSRIQANRASILNRTGQYEEASALAQSAVHLAQTRGAVADEAMAYLQWGRALWFQGNYEAAHPILEKAMTGRGLQIIRLSRRKVYGDWELSICPGANMKRRTSTLSTL